jgi:hypothetical protein
MTIDEMIAFWEQELEDYKQTLTWHRQMIQRKEKAIQDIEDHIKALRLPVGDTNSQTPETSFRSVPKAREHD